MTSPAPKLLALLLLLPAALSCACGEGGGASGDESTTAACVDQVDNDGDGATDCADPGCQHLFVCSASDTESEADSETDTAEGPGAAVRGVRVRKVVLCQTVCTELDLEGRPSDPVVPIVPGREALLRFFYDFAEIWDFRTTWGELRFSSPTHGAETVTRKLHLEESSTETSLDSTINFALPADAVEDGLGIAFALREEGSFVGPDGYAAEAAWPVDGMIDLAIAPPEDPVRIILVPVRYAADGSGRLPDVSAEAIAGFEAMFEAMYPIEAVEITVAGPLDWEQAVSADGSGWSDLLGAITGLREENGAFEEYYFGLFDPADSFSEYCAGGCVLGLSWLAEAAGSTWARSSIGLGYDGVAADTMVHEVGHAHGLAHAPCGSPAGVDPDYPHAGGAIGGTGYDAIENTLVPSDAFDFMTYCDPDWVSDYHYVALRDRIEEVNASAKSAAGPTSAWTGLIVDADGSVSLGPTVRLASPPRGEPRRITLRDATARPLAEVAGRLQPFADLPGGMILFPTPGPAAAFAELDGFAPLALDPPPSSHGPLVRPRSSVY